MKRRVLIAASLIASAACKTSANRLASAETKEVSPEASVNALGVVCHEEPIDASANLGDMRHKVCAVPSTNPMRIEETKNLHVMTLKGTFQEIAYAHGYILNREIDQGVLRELEPRIRAMLIDGSAPERLMVECLTNRMYASVSTEFQQAIEAFWQGYQNGARAAGRTPFMPDTEIGHKVFRSLALAVELENVSDGIVHRFQDDLQYKLKPLSEIIQAGGDSKKAVDELIAKCSFETREAAAAGLAGIKDKLFKNGEPMKLACTGFASTIGQFIHARNLDSDSATSWSDQPALFLVHEKLSDGRWGIPYAAPGSVGMFFMGGIGGQNAAGLTVALHQMYTNIYRIGEDDAGADIAPFVTQKILREAATLEDAEQLVRKRQKHFGAWTEVIGDAKTNDVVSIELSGAKDLAEKGVDVFEGSETQPARRVRGAGWLAQSNHFFSKIQNAAYTPFFNKYLETRSRFQAVEEALKEGERKGKIDVKFAVDTLSSHYDPLEGSRSFGRTIAKVYGAMSHIMVPMTGKKNANSGWPEKSEVWLTVGERVKPTGYTGSERLYLSSSQSTFAGFEIDWDRLTAEPVNSSPSAIRTTQYDDTPHWLASLSIYIQARHTYVRGSEADKRAALDLLNQAIAEAERENKNHPRMKDRPQIIYSFIRARVNHELKNFAQANQEWEGVLWPFYKNLAAPFFDGSGNVRPTKIADPKMHHRAYQAAATAYYSVVSAIKAGKPLGASEVKKRLDFARKVFSEEGLAEPTRHPDLKRKLYAVNTLAQNPRAEIGKMQAIDFVFLE